MTAARTTPETSAARKGMPRPNGGAPRVAKRRAGATALAVLACVSGVTAFSLVSVEQEVEIGREAQREMQARIPEVRDETVNRYIDRLGSRLAAQAPGARYPYSFSVANYRETNAMALPGGPVWVHRGAIESARTEAQLAGVLAHEVAHIAQRHAADQLTKATVTGGLLQLLGAALGRGGEGRGEAAARIGASVAAQSLFMKFSRDDEREADRVGAQIAERAGWDPHGLVEFLGVLRDQQQRSPGAVAAFLSTHPSPAGRAQELQALVRGKSGRRDSQEFQAIRQRLDRMAPAQAMPRQ